MMKPSSSNAVHIYRRKDSNWYCVAVYIDGKRKKFSGRAFNLHIDSCSIHEAELIVRKRLGMSTTAHDYSTLGGLLETMIPRIEMEGLSETTQKEYRLAIEHLITVTGTGFKTKDVNKSHVALLQESMLTGDKAVRPPTVNKTLRHLHGIFSRLLDDEYIDRNPFHKFRRIREEKPVRNLTREQAKAFLLSIAGDADYPDRAHVARILLYTGLRLNEVMTMPRENIDLENMRLLVTLSKDRGKGVKYWLPAHEKIHADIRALCQSESPLPFHICHSDTLSHWIKDHFDKIGCHDLKCHSLRHTLVTLAGESGEALWRIQAQTGHSSITVTEGYFHPTLDRAVDPKIE